MSGKTYWTTDELRALLRKRYPAPAYALFEELANGTGGHKSRSADALAFSLWPSRGLGLYGFEIKVSRGDLQRELAAPAKAEAIQKFCHAWWIVAPEHIVRIDELPKTWGLLVPGEKGLRVVRDAPELQPEPLNLPMLASLFRNLHESEHARFRSRIDDEVDERLRQRATGDTAALQHLEKRYDELLQKVRDFEKASGIDLSLSHWPVGDVGAAVRALLKGGDDVEGLKRHATWAANTYRAALRQAEELEAALEKALPAKPEAAA